MHTIAEFSTHKKPRFDKAYLPQSILSEGFTLYHEPLNFYMYAYAVHMYTFSPLVTPRPPPPISGNYTYSDNRTILMKSDKI